MGRQLDRGAACGRPPAHGAAPVTVGQVGAALTGVSAAVHVLLATSSSLAGLVMAVMAPACLPCAWHLWRTPTAAVWKLTALLDVTMLLLHVQLLADGTTHGHHAGSPGGLMWTGLALAAGSLAVSAVALAHRYRRAASAPPA